MTKTYNDLMTLIYSGRRSKMPTDGLSKDRIMISAINQAMSQVERPVTDTESPSYMRKPVAIFVQHGITATDVDAWYEEVYGHYNQETPKFKALRGWIATYKSGSFVLSDSEPVLYEVDGSAYAHTETAEDFFGTKKTFEEKIRAVKAKKKSK